MKPINAALVVDEMFPEGGYAEEEQSGGQSLLEMGSEKDVHADFYNGK